MSTFDWINRLLGIILVCLCIRSFVVQNDYKRIEDIDPRTFQDPIQLKVSDSTPINFTKSGYDYTLYPLYSYDLRGLIASKKDYRTFSLQLVDQLFPIDLCIVWGDPLKNKLHKTYGIYQSGRWCFFSSADHVDNDRISNNHLIPKDERVQKQIDSLAPGDQVRIVGKLVNLTASKVTEGTAYNPSGLEAATSTVRTDTGDSACEIIYVEEVEVLKKGETTKIKTPHNLLGLKQFWAL